MRAAFPFLIGLLLGGVGDAVGQPDSLAAVARAKFREAVTAERAGDLARARDLIADAHRAWPTQVAYLVAAADLSARLADSAGTVRWLGVLADLGAGLDVERRPVFAALKSAPGMAGVSRRLAANIAPLIRSDSVAGIPDPEFFPEGMDYDPGSRSWFVASIRRRTIARIGPDGSVVDFPKPGSERLDAVLGVRVDATRGIVWATTRTLPTMLDHRPGDPVRARVWAFELTTGKLLGMAEAAPAEPHLFGDLVVDPSGGVFLTDSESPILFQARLEAGRLVLEERLRHRFFRSLQGLAIAADGRHLYVADYSHGLLRVDPGTGVVAPIAAPSGISTLGLDGIARAGGSIIGVQNGFSPARVVRFRLSPPGDRVVALDVLDRHLPVADEPTIGAIVGNRFVYVANSQWEKYDDDGKRRPQAVLRPPVLLAVPLEP